MEWKQDNLDSTQLKSGRDLKAPNRLNSYSTVYNKPEKSPVTATKKQRSKLSNTTIKRLSLTNLFETSWCC